VLTIVFFAQTREIIDQGSVNVDFTPALKDLDTLRQLLADRGDKWDLALQQDKLLVAVNQQMCDWQTEVKDGDEVAFFPPVTGG